MPFMNSIRPQRHKTSLSQLIVNGALVLILSSALPLLSRILGMCDHVSFCFVYSSRTTSTYPNAQTCILNYILNVPRNNNKNICAYYFSSQLWVRSGRPGITNFDLLGDYGEIEWLGNFQIVLLYNVIFVGTITLCLVNKFTATVRQELCNRLVENYILFANYVTFIN